MAPLVRTGGSRHTGLAAPPHRNIQLNENISKHVYLYRLAEESPLLYAKLVLKENGLQDYVDAMNELN